MKYRKWHILPLLILLLMLLALPAQASEYRFVFDEAALLTTYEAAELDQEAAEISVRYGCGMYIVTLFDYSEYGSNVRSAAENYFLTHDLGLGSDDSGVLLMLSMLERDYALVAHGDLGNTAFTDYGKDVLSEEFWMTSAMTAGPMGLRITFPSVKHFWKLQNRELRWT